MRLAWEDLLAETVMMGDSKIPMSYNLWLFGYSNPALYLVRR